MREMIKMVIVLTLLSSISGGLLAAVRSSTKERIEGQVLEFVQGPAIRKIMEGASNDPIKDRFTLKSGDTEKNFFVGVFDGKPSVVAFETSATGFGGEVGIMVGVDVKTDKIVGIDATTLSESPGYGANLVTDKEFKNQFKGMPIASAPKVKKDGGDINALSGATITSRATAAAVTKAGEIYQQFKPEIEKQLNTFSG